MSTSTNQANRDEVFTSTIPSASLTTEPILSDNQPSHDNDSSKGVSHEGGDIVRSITGFKWFLVCFSLYFASIVYGLDNTIAADIQGAVYQRFNEIEQLTWLGTGFPMASLCAILPAGILYSVFDLKMLFIGSVVLFETGSALCGAAPTMDALIVGRVIAGVGGSGLYIGLLNYFSTCTSHAERGLYMSGIGFFWGIGAILGPVVGGAFSSSSATWRWSFYINLLIAAITAPVYMMYLPSLIPPGAGSFSVITRLRKIDWVGVLLSTGVIVTIVMALTFAGAAWQWNDGRTIAMFVVFGALLVILIIQQYFAIFTTQESRIFPSSRLLRTFPQVLLYIQTACSTSNVFIPLYYIPIYFQFVHGDSSIMAAVRLLPFILVLVCVNISSGYILPKIPFYQILYLVSGVFMTIGASLLFTVTMDTPVAKVYGYSIIIAIGAGPFAIGYPIAGIKMSLSGGSAKELGDVIALQNYCTVGGTVAPLLISGQIFQSLALKNMRNALKGSDFSDAQIRSLVGGAGSTLFKSLDPETAAAATQAITSAISKIYILGICMAVLSLISACLMKPERLFQQAKTNVSVEENAEEKL